MSKSDTSGTVTLGGYDTILDAKISIEEDSMSTSIVNLAKAQCKVQDKLTVIAKDASGFHAYTSLDRLMIKVKPILKAHGITFFQMPVSQSSHVGVRTIWTHTSGEWINSSIYTDIVEIPGVNLYQSIGQSITYFRRYSLLSFLGLASGPDDDGALKPPKLSSDQKAEAINIWKTAQEKLPKIAFTKFKAAIMPVDQKTNQFDANKFNASNFDEVIANAEEYIKNNTPTKQQVKNKKAGK